MDIVQSKYMPLWSHHDTHTHAHPKGYGHGAGLNRGVPMDWSTQIMGGEFRKRMNSEVVTFSTRLAVQPSPLHKSNGEKARWQPPISVSYFLMGPNGLSPLFRSSSMAMGYSNPLLISVVWNEPKLLSSCLPRLKCEDNRILFCCLVLTRWHGTLTYCPIPWQTFNTRPMYIT